MKIAAYAVLALSLLAVTPVTAQTKAPGGMKTGPELADKNAIPLPGVECAGENKELWFEAPKIGRVVRNVTQPTITPYLLTPGTGNGAAVIVAPGGAFMALSFDMEGKSVAEALNARGITAFVLKYHLHDTPSDMQEFMRFTQQRLAQATKDPNGPRGLEEPRAAEDVLAALALVRSRAREWGVDPNRIGLIGFSAGAMTSLSASLKAQPGEGPNFLGYIYGPMQARDVPASAPPMFAASAMDDTLLPPGSFDLVQKWRAAGRPVELHAYQKGGHGFGTGVPGTTTVLVIPEFVEWLSSQGFLTKPK